MHKHAILGYAPSLRNIFLHCFLDSFWGLMKKSIVSNDLFMISIFLSSAHEMSEHEAYSLCM